MARWGLSQSPHCSFCLNPESLLHVVAGCQQYLNRFTWRRDSILNFIAKSLQPAINAHFSLYADFNGFLNPSIITGENYRPDLLFLIQSKCLYVLELSVGFESNLNNDAVRKKEKYLNLINEMSRNYRCVRFVNLSMSSLGVFSGECSTFLDMMNDIGIDKKQQRYIIRKMINIAIRATYFCFIFVFFVFVFVFLFNNPISSSIFELPIHSEIYNCTFKNTNKISIIIIIIIIIIIVIIIIAET